jgi:hypothetical protein
MGLYKIYKYLIIRYICIYIIAFTLLFSSLKSFAFVPYKPTVAIEVIYKTNNKTIQNRLLNFCVKYHFIDANDIYQWANHFVIYGAGYEKFYAKIKSSFTDCEVKFYDKPFYDFERSRCTQTQTSSRLDNILLTANLVADPKLQQEYLNYHATQFEKWPEISNGFCNAKFQRLLVFKNGRQLMLVISIPKGESLDKLNPLTTKNNPRVNGWNKIMARYQEGIAGTKKNEIWVFLKAYNQANHINHN